MIQFFGVNKRVEEDKRKVISLLVDRIFIIESKIEVLFTFLLFYFSRDFSSFHSFIFRGTMNKKKQTSVYLNEKDIEIYQRLYPRTLGLFLCKAIHLAIKDKEYFYKTFTSNEQEQ